MEIAEGAWRTRQQFADEVQLLLGQVDSVEYFTSSRPEIRWLRGAWIANSFAEKVRAVRVRALPETQWPDFEVELEDGAILACEATEAQMPGRLRGNEYRQLRNEGWPAIQNSLEVIKERRAAAPVALQLAVSKKLQKGYPPGAAALVIYLNIGCSYHDDSELPDFAALTKEATERFSSVWVLFGGRLHKCWPNEQVFE